MSDTRARASELARDRAADYTIDQVSEKLALRAVLRTGDALLSSVSAASMRRADPRCESSSPVPCRASYLFLRLRKDTAENTLTCAPVRTYVCVVPPFSIVHLYITGFVSATFSFSLVAYISPRLCQRFYL